MTIVETTVWIDYLANRSTPHTHWLEQNPGVKEVGLTDLIFLEVLQGFKSDKEFDEIERRLLRLPIFPSGGREMALDTAQLQDIACQGNYRAEVCGLPDRHVLYHRRLFIAASRSRLRRL